MINLLRLVYYWLVTGLVGLFGLLFFPCRVRGREHIPVRGGFIFAANHESNIDPVLLPTVSPRRMRFLAKDSLFRNPVLGALIRCGGGIPLRRGSADRGALDAALDSIRQGWPVLMFPQGTRGGEKVLPGVGFLAVKSGAPVIPVLIEGTDRVLPKGRSVPCRAWVRVTFGPPVSFPPDTDYPSAAEQIMAAVKALKAG